MRTLLIPLALAALLGAAPTPTTPGPQLDRYLTQMARLGRFNGVALLAIDGKVVLRKGYGYADAATRTTMKPDAQFEFASISKMFTAFAILQLRDRGLLSLDDPICKYLDTCPAAWQPITIDQVIHHRSGIPDYEDALDIESPAYMDFMERPDSARRILAREMPLPLDFAPGTKFSYSNTGYIVLATIAARASGMSFPRLLHQAILDPAGMTTAGVFGYDTPDRLVPGYALDSLTWAQRMPGFDIAAQHARAFPLLPLTPPHGDADIFGTVDDLYRWTQLTQGSALVSSEDAATIFTPVDGYGFGWIVDTQLGTQRYMHTGELPGYLSNVTIYPQKHVTLILLDNFDTPTEALARDAGAIALGQPWDMPFSGPLATLPDSAFAPLIGTYALTNGKTLTVSKDSDLLLASIEGQYKAGLLPFSPTRFYMPLSSGQVTFTDIRDGVAHAIDLRYNGIDHRGTRIP